jgi:hypothetical protein
MDALNKVKNKLDQLDYKFIHKPILIGGVALEYYGIRKSIHDIDFIISQDDKKILIDLGYELNLFGGKTEYDVDATFTNIKNLDIDLAVSMNQYKYDFFIRNSKQIDNENVLICSLEDLLLLKVLASEYSHEIKHQVDVTLIIKAIERHNYK